ncbi:MAG: tetratricopeptide repeat protein [bacterium]|nr:tetratricopeptide repeat protein [bacterium]
MRKTLTATLFALLLLSMSASAFADAASDAAEMIQHRKFDEAITFLNSAITKDPTYADLYYWLGRIYIEKEDWAQAETQLNKCLELKKRHDEAKAYLALVYIQNERWEEAKKILDEGVAKSKTAKGRFLNHLGHYHVAKKEFSEADIALRKAELEEPTNIEYKRDLADMNYENGVYAVAVNGYKDVLMTDSTDVITYFKLARAYYMQKQFKEAIDNSSKAIGLDSNYTQAYSLQGDIFMILGLSRVSAALESGESGANGYTDIFKNAIWAYEHYVATGGKETLDLLYRLGQAYYYVGGYELAIEKLRRAIDMGSDKSVAFDFTAKALFRLKRYDEAVNAYKAYENKISQGDPNFVWGPEYFEFFRDRGVTYSQLFYDSKKEGVPDTSFLDQAIVNLTKAVELKPDEKSLIYRLGFDLYNRTSYTEAIPWFEKRIAIDSTHLQSYQYIAFSYIKMNDFTKAVEYLELMYKLKPDSPFVLKTLSTTYLFQIKNREKGMEWLRKWADTDTKDYEPYKWIGFIYISEKPPKKEQAIEALTKCLQRMEANGVDKCKEIDVITWMAQALSFYDTLDKDEEALKWVNRGLQCAPNNETLKNLKENLDL